MIFQDPMTSLNPTMTIGNQIMEGLIKHQGMSKADARKVALELIDLVGIPNQSSFKTISSPILRWYETACSYCDGVSL